MMFWQSLITDEDGAPHQMSQLPQERSNKLSCSDHAAPSRIFHGTGTKDAESKRGGGTAVHVLRLIIKSDTKTNRRPVNCCSSAFKHPPPPPPATAGVCSNLTKVLNISTLLRLNSCLCGLMFSRCLVVGLDFVPGFRRENVI